LNPSKKGKKKNAPVSGTSEAVVDHQRKISNRRPCAPEKAKMGGEGGPKAVPPIESPASENGTEQEDASGKTRNVPAALRENRGGLQNKKISGRPELPVGGAKRTERE